MKGESPFLDSPTKTKNSLVSVPRAEPAASGEASEFNWEEVSSPAMGDALKKAFSGSGSLHLPQGQGTLGLGQSTRGPCLQTGVLNADPRELPASNLRSEGAAEAFPGASASSAARKALQFSEKAVPSASRLQPPDSRESCKGGSFEASSARLFLEASVASPAAEGGASSPSRGLARRYRRYLGRRLARVQLKQRRSAAAAKTEVERLTPPHTEGRGIASLQPPSLANKSRAQAKTQLLTDTAAASPRADEEGRRCCEEEEENSLSFSLEDDEALLTDSDSDWSRGGARSSPPPVVSQTDAAKCSTFPSRWRGGAGPLDEGPSGAGQTTAVDSRRAAFDKSGFAGDKAAATAAAAVYLGSDFAARTESTADSSGGRVFAASSAGEKTPNLAADVLWGSASSTNRVGKKIRLLHAVEQVRRKQTLARREGTPRSAPGPFLSSAFRERSLSLASRRAF